MLIGIGIYIVGTSLQAAYTAARGSMSRSLFLNQQMALIFGGVTAAYFI
jgi:hypothetical protein